MTLVDSAPVPDPRPSMLWRLSYSFWAYQYKRTWRSSVTTSFLFPILYLTAMGVGLGTLVNRHSGHVQGVSFLDFIAPGLLASTAMQIGANDSTYPVMESVKWSRTYYAMLASPLRVIDVVRGHLAWIATRIAIVTTVYLVVIAAFGAALSPWALLAVPAAVLAGMAFAAPIAAFSAAQENDAPFATLNRLVIIPLFLFSGTFFPVSQLPGWLQPVAYATPLFHGVELCRDLDLGQVHAWPLLGDVAYLVVLVAIGYKMAARTFKMRLEI